MFDSVHEECGVFGIYSNHRMDVASDAYLALYALQHRGQESCGIAVNDKGVIKGHKDVGLIPDVFTPEVMAKLPEGQMAVGHVRYSTTGNVSAVNAQPMMIKHIKGNLALAHNGNLVNAFDLRHELSLEGVIFHTTNDTEVIAYKVAKERLNCDSIEAALEKVMYEIKGAYSLVVMSNTKLIAARDPDGMRPLCMGAFEDGYVFASESCALDTIGATFVREIEPGEIVVISKGQVRSIKTHCKGVNHMCVFEYVYFARPDSVIEGSSVSEARQLAGAFLAKEHPVEADVVIGAPDSGLDAALGYARESGIPYGVGLVKNRYVGRTFIQPSQKQREKSVRIKLNPVISTVKGKRVVLVDDSIVRGTTSRRIVRLLKDAGATEVHMRISAPPFTHPCFFGTDIDSKENLIACKMSIPEICKHIEADSLGYLSIDDVKKIARNSNCDFCTACFSGEYPMDVSSATKKDKFEEYIEE